MFTKKLSITSFSLIIIIIIIAAFFRLYNITQTPPGLYPDEAMNGNNLLEAISTNNYKIFYPENNGREGLFINIQALSVMIFGNQPWALRLPSAIFGILTVLGIYFLAKELFRKNFQFSPPAGRFHFQSNTNNQNSKFQINEKIALLSAFLIATSFWHVNFSRIGFRAIMAPFFLVWGIYFLLKSLNAITDDQEKIAGKKLPNKCEKFPAILGGLFFGLGFYSYIAYRATPLIIGTIFLGYWLQNKSWEIRKRIMLIAILFSIFTILAIAPIGYYFISNPQDFFGRTSQISVFSSQNPISDLVTNTIKTLGMFNFSGDWNWRHNYAGAPQLYWPVGIMFLVGTFFAIINIFKKKSLNNARSAFPFIISFVWLITAMLPVIISNEGLPHALRAILMLPPVIILSAFGGILAYEKIRELIPYKKSLLFFSFFTFIIIISSAYNLYFIDWAKNPNTDGAFSKDYADIGKELNSLPKEMPKYVIVQAGGTDVRGIPMPTQTVMFITDTFTPEKQKQKNIFYILPDQINKIPNEAYIVTIK